MNDTATQITLYVTATSSLVYCPVCTYPTRRIHSHYTRTLMDLPWGGTHVQVRLRVRKFSCANGRCTHQIFTERLPRLVSPWACRTQRLTDWLTAIGLALGGQQVPG